MLNEVFVEALLAGEPIANKTEAGKTVCTFNVACYRDGFGKGIDFIKCKAYGKVAEMICTRLKKGAHFIICGSILQQKYENYKGEDIRELFLRVKFVKFLPKEQTAKYADEFFEANPPLKKLYNQFVLQNKSENENEIEEENEE